MSYDVNAKRQGLSTLIDIKTSTSELIDWLPASLLPLPDTANTAKRSEELIMYWIGPGHWLLRGPIDQEYEIIEKLNLQSVPSHISAILISDSLCFFELTGSDVDQVVSIVSPLDIHQSVFPENGVSFTEAFGLKAALIRIQTGFELAVDTSYADMLEDYLKRAGASFE